VKKAGRALAKFRRDAEATAKAIAKQVYEKCEKDKLKARMALFRAIEIIEKKK
jgi:hypothetical protein